jgi:ATP-dependent Lon protease
MVAFPSVMMSLHVGRPSSIKAVQTATDNDGLILILAQRNPDTENPSAKELFSIGVVASIVRTLRLPDGRYKVLLQGIVRARVSRSKVTGGVSYAEIAPLAPVEVARISAEDEAIINRVRENLQVLVE